MSLYLIGSQRTENQHVIELSNGLVSTIAQPVLIISDKNTD